MNNRLINTKVAGGGGGCTDIVDNYDPFGDSSGLALWQFNGNANDLSNNSLNGVWTGTESYGTGVFGQSAIFNGGTNYIDIPSFNQGSQVSFSYWIKRGTQSDAIGVILDKREGSDATNFYTYYYLGNVGLSKLEEQAVRV